MEIASFNAPRRLLFRLPLVILLVPALSGAGPASRAPDGQAPAGNPSIISKGSAVKSGPPPDLAIFYAGEVIGWTEPCG